MRYKPIILIITTMLMLTFGLSWVSSGFESMRGWGSFFAVVTLGGGFLLGGWYALKNEAIPGWVGWLMIGAVLLRIGIGVVWYVVLPIWGYGTDGELAGYVMSDAYKRDISAWELARSSKPLFTAFQEYRLADQYGGLLFLSAAIYRYLGGNWHQPLMMVVVSASFSALSIAFIWSFVHRLWGDGAAKAATWIFTSYPDAILLGSSQMREAFMMSLAGMALYGLILYWQERKWQGIGWVIVSLLVSLPLSSLFSVLLLAMLLAVIIIINRGQIFRHWILWIVLGCLILLGITGVWFLGERIYPEGASSSSPWELLSRWLVFAARWEKRTATISSGWFEKILIRSPEWMHFWIILGYGTVQPFLPAALIALGNWTWRVIAIWRSIGWTFLLIFLIYAPVRAVQKISRDFIPAGFSLLVWTGILLSAYRGGGDQWDNPRYRVTFIILQAALAGWVWAEQRKNPDPWLHRILVGIGWIFAWFIPWYLRRYTSAFTWPVIDLFKTVGLGFTCAVLYGVWHWVNSEDDLGHEE